MPTTPLFRRILPWLYLAIFIIVAPLLILYTSGYRYNIKKAKIERNGTLIIDSNPKGASVIIDDHDTGEKTPISFQNMPPGWHTIRITKDGYHSWQKNLDVRPEQVSFANHVWLWRKTEPVLDLSGDVRRSQTNPSQDKIALLLRSASSTQFQLFIPNTPWNMEPIRFPEPSVTPLDIHWKEDGQAIFFASDHAEEKTWWSNVSQPQPSLESLPPGNYRWSDADLINVRDRTILHLQPQTGTLTRELLEPTVVDKENGFTLQTSTGTSGIIFRNHLFWSQRFSLPTGHWRIAQSQKPYLLFRDQDQWLAVNTQKNNEELYAGQANGDDLRWLPKAKTPTALMMNQSELWLWPLGESPTLLWRQSEPLVQTVWHGSGSSIFVATQHEIFSLEINDQNGRLVTPLATFTRINDITLLDKTLYVAGEKDGKQGLWSLEVE